MRRTCLIFPILAGIIMSVILTGPIAAEEAKDITIGRIITIPSTVLAEKRIIWLSLPEGYEKNKQPYPVLYLLDGPTHFLYAKGMVDFFARNGLMPQMIIVAIANTQRGRDFTPSQTEKIKNSGGAGKFLSFLKTELIPYVDGQYRTAPLRLLFGHSLCGMFSTYTLFQEPDLFAAHITASPYLQYDDDYVLKVAADAMQQKMELPRYLSVNWGNEPAYDAPIKRLDAMLKKHAPAAFRWQVHHLTDETHGTIPFQSLSKGLLDFFSKWRFSAKLADKGVKGIKEYYASLQEAYGYKVPVSEVLVNNLGYKLLFAKKVDDAIAVFRYNVDVFPGSANVYDSLGEGLQAKGLYQEAQKNYRIAVEKGTATKAFGLKIFKEHLKAVEELIKTKQG